MTAAVPDPVDPRDATPQVGQALQIWVANHHWEAALSIQTLRDKLRQAREALTTAETQLTEIHKAWVAIGDGSLPYSVAERAMDDAIGGRR